MNLGNVGKRPRNSLSEQDATPAKPPKKRPHGAPAPEHVEGARTRATSTLALILNPVSKAPSREDVLSAPCIRESVERMQALRNARDAVDRAQTPLATFQAEKHEMACWDALLPDEQLQAVEELMADCQRLANSVLARMSDSDD